MSDYKNTEEATPEGNFKIRFIIFLSIFAVFAIVVLFGYARLMTGPESARTRSSPPIQERGPILDRNGRILAMQTRLANISIWKPVVEDLNSLLQILSPVLGISTEELNTRINTSRSDFIYAAKRVDQSIFTEVERLRKEGRLRGVGVEYISARIYPEQRLASYVTGFVGDDNTGLEGVELTMNSLLAPSQNMPYGHQVFLTIDANVQYKLESIARTTMQENKAEAVLMIAMRPDTGEILGYVSMPDFDPNEFRSTPAEQRINRAAVYRYEPGSVFKIFSIASIMELGGINEYSTFRCNGRYENITPGGERVVINCLGAHGIVSPREIITYSCNSGAAYAADTVSNEAFDSKIRDLGFGSRTNAGFSGESPGDIAPLNAWSLRTKQTIAIGQELSVTALQILKAATAIANDGLLVQPHIVSAVVASDGSLVQDYRQEAPKRVLSAETAAAMRSFMESAASEAGTGRRAGLDDIPLAVKQEQLKSGIPKRKSIQRQIS
jgi:cell division protein FtsI (penicillin-binding protein 3)